MKRVSTIFAAVLLTASLYGQSPEKMSYQAVIRGANNYLVTNQPVGMQISILQGSPTGTTVYEEIQTATTNRNGLVAVEIGAGVTSDDFSTIDWTNGPYFIMTETDPTGGTNYTVTGTSQMLSVPFALHAKTAEVITGTIPETDPVFLSSQAVNITSGDITNLGTLSGTNTGDQDLSALATRTALGDSTAKVRSEIPDVSGFLLTETDPLYTGSEAANISATDIVNLDNLSGTNTGDQDGSETIVHGGLNVTVTGSGTSGDPYVVNATGGGAVAAIGDSYGGGIVFWVDATGQHGLIAATSDQSAGIQWFNGAYSTTGATIEAVYGGEANTNMITANQGSGSYAAQLCADYSVTVNNEYFDDWYLPSLYELNLLYPQQGIVGGFEIASYWSSTEASSTSAWLKGFHSSIELSFVKEGAYHVRAIRAF